MFRGKEQEREKNDLERGRAYLVVGNLGNRVKSTSGVFHWERRGIFCGAKGTQRMSSRDVRVGGTR